MAAPYADREERISLSAASIPQLGLVFHLSA
jgi:hypothetical protein